MSLEDSINTLALAIESLADALQKSPAQIEPRMEIPSPKKGTKPQCMDAAGLPTSFKRRCGICGELGRYRSSHRDEMRDGTYHWVEVSQ